MAHRDKSQSPEFTVGIDAKRTFVDKRSRPNLQRMTRCGHSRRTISVVSGPWDISARLPCLSPSKTKSQTNAIEPDTVKLRCPRLACFHRQCARQCSARYDFTSRERQIVRIARKQLNQMTYR